MMIAPHTFSFNSQTSESNQFQNKTNEDHECLSKQALKEFNKCVKKLEKEGINVICLDEPKEFTAPTPDAVFCNNWITTTPDGSIVLYPMATANRRTETKRIGELVEKLNHHKLEFTNLYNFSEDLEVLEGTGSMVIDHVHKFIYAAISSRTYPKQIEKLIKSVKYYSEFKPVLFETRTSTGDDFYHTNVMMSVGSTFAVICTESIVEHHREDALNKLKETGKEIIDISIEQTEKFYCGNVIQLGDTTNSVIVMSDSAKNGFTTEQLQKLQNHGKIVVFPISKTIEFVGGGSARCMIAEIFLPKNKNL
eukprot:gene7678-12144_t